jgi:hypothetical protein
LYYIGEKICLHSCNNESSVPPQGPCTCDRALARRLLWNPTPCFTLPLSNISSHPIYQGCLVRLPACPTAESMTLDVNEGRRSTGAAALGEKKINLLLRPSMNNTANRRHVWFSVIAFAFTHSARAFSPSEWVKGWVLSNAGPSQPLTDASQALVRGNLL